MAPEFVLIAVACGLFLLGVSSKASARRMAPVVAVLTLAGIFIWQLSNAFSGAGVGEDPWGAFVVGPFAIYVKMLTAGMGALLVLLAWPTNEQATGSSSMDFGHDAGEFYALMLLSLSGVMLVSGANDIILLFLGIELASIPTYIMVSISRPLPVAQEAGVKYFFLGAMSAAIMLFGFSYLYGTTGMTQLTQITQSLHASTATSTANIADARLAWAATALSPWQLLAVVMLLGGFAFKIAAVPLHAYAGDVYQGAATPVTAFLAFVPKTTGFVAILKILSAVGGPHWTVGPMLTNVVIVVAALTMSVGNVLGLLQFNVKRVFAYSSIAHSGYMLVGVAALIHAPQLLAADGDNADAISQIQDSALQGVLFYLAAYGLMNAGAFGVLMLLPSRQLGPDGKPANPVATSAETWDDLAGAAKRHPGLGLAMAVCCFSLIGLPLTIGFFGKVYLIKPALDSRLNWLVIITMINAAVSAAYYLRIVATMYLRPELPAPAGESEQSGQVARAVPLPIAAAIALSVAGTLLFGIVLPAANSLTNRAQAARLSPPTSAAPSATSQPSAIPLPQAAAR